MGEGSTYLVKRVEMKKEVMKRRTCVAKSVYSAIPNCLFEFLWNRTFQSLHLLPLHHFLCFLSLSFFSLCQHQTTSRVVVDNINLELKYVFSSYEYIPVRSTGFLEFYMEHCYLSIEFLLISLNQLNLLFGGNQGGIGV
jgi:hypothetical protein